MICGNRECQNETGLLSRLKTPKKYCSLKCRNIEVNRTRDYEKISDTFTSKRSNAEIQYYESPRLCKNCQIVIDFLLRRNEFCGHACSAKFNNLLRDYSQRKPISEEGLANIRRANKSIENRRNHSETLKKRYQEQGHPSRGVDYVTEDEYKLNPKFCEICVALIEYSKRKNKTCSRDCKLKLQSKLSTDNPNCGGETNYKKFIYKNISFDSSWEVQIAEYLDKHNIDWVRSRKIMFNWFDASGKRRRYYPDFYLPAYNMYLDPKNKYLQQQDHYKISKVIELNAINLKVGDMQFILDEIDKIIK